MTQDYILKAILESPRDIVIVALDRDYRYLAFNDAHRRVMKQIWNVDIHVGQNMLYEVVGREDDRTKAKQNFDRALAGEHFVVTEEFGDENLSRRYYEDVYGPIRDARGEVVGLTIYLTDITEQKLAQDQLEIYRLRLESLVEDRTAALRRSEERYRTLVLNAPIAALVHRERRILFANPAAIGLFGAVDEASLVGRPMTDLVVSDVVHRMESKDRLTGAEVIVSRRDGKTADVEWTSIPVDFEGAPATFSLVVDVTARKEMELERRRLEEQMRHAQKLESLGVLAGGIAHDFNNLLVGILGNADLALRELAAVEGGGEDLRLQIERIKVAATRAAELARRMLAYAGKGTYVVRPIDLNALVSEMVDLLHVSVSKSSRLELELASDLRPIEGDSAQMRQIVMNLVTNAADAVADSGGTVSVRTYEVEADRALLSSMVVADSLEPGRYVCLEVSDTGLGIDDKTRSCMFDPFFTTKDQGRGLGLAAVLGIVRSHQGGLIVDSEPGRGTTFRVLLRCAEGATAVAEASAPDAMSWRASGTLLIADDDARVREVLKMMMSAVGFHVIEAENATKCLELHRQHRGNVVMLMVDLMMPGGGGRAVVAGVRRDGDRVPIVVSSGYSEDALGADLRDDPLVAFLEKPYEFETLVRTIRRLLETAQTLAQSDVTWPPKSDTPRTA